LPFFEATRDLGLLVTLRRGTFMSRIQKTDPYGGFKDDAQRRRALGTRDRWRYGCWAVVAICVSAGNSSWLREQVTYLLRVLGG
jgi:hypothetical protein